MEWLIVSDGTPQLIYVGQSNKTDEEISEISERGGFLTLEDCRCIRTIMLPGPNGSFVLQNTVTPVGISRSGVRLRIKPASYIRPAEDHATLEAMLEQIKHCAANEVKHRLADAGLTLPSGGNVTPLKHRG